MPAPTLEMFSQYLRDVELPKYGDRIKADFRNVLDERMKNATDLMDQFYKQARKLAHMSNEKDIVKAESELTRINEEMLRNGFNTMTCYFLNKGHNFNEAKLHTEATIRAMNLLAFERSIEEPKASQDEKKESATPKKRTRKNDQENNKDSQ